MTEKEEEMSDSRKALTEFVRRCEARDEEKRLARLQELQPSTPPPPPPLEPVALEPDPAPQPCPCPDEDLRPAPATKPALSLPPAPKTVMPPCDFTFGSRGPGGYGWPPPEPEG